LLREENEGFAKLLAEINQENLNKANIEVVISNIYKMIGYFSLDPNRVLELILCAYQFNLTNIAYLRLLREFGSKHTISQLLGFKIAHVHLVAESQSLFDLVAMLIKDKQVDIADIWSHFDWPGKPEND
jgi:THO complex subunit 2